MSIVTNPNIRFVVAGNALLQEPVSREALELSGVEKPNVLLLGTAKATPESFQEFVTKSTVHFTDLGANVANLHNFEEPISQQEMEDKILSSDVLWVAGGDTLKLVDFWREQGYDRLINTAALNGTVLSGGSAGMLAWFESGHSDSLSYRVKENDPWDYIFVKGLGYLAAAGCPHFDGKTGDARLREEDFLEKFAADDTLPEVGIGITNRGALALYDNTYKVVHVPDAEKPTEVHIMTKNGSAIERTMLPINNDYVPLTF